MSDSPIFSSDDIPEHESPLRRMMANAHSLDYAPLKSLDEAKAHSDGIAILEDDYGGQIFVVCHAHTIRCSEDVLRQLLVDLDDITWGTPDKARILYERKPVGSSIAGGMGGARVGSEIWIHPELKDKGLEKAIVEVIEGKRPRI